MSDLNENVEDTTSGKHNLAKAMDAVLNGMTVHTASVKFKVPKTTLYRHHIRKLPANIKQGAPSILTKEQEGHLCTWIEHMAKCGFPISKDLLLDSVTLLVKDLKIKNTFRDGRPGIHWYNLFLKRNPSISKRISQYLIKSRVQVTESKIRNWFAEIHTYAEENGFINIFDEPERVFNCDETAFFLSPKENSVLAKKGQKSVYSVVSNDEKENLTTLVMGNAKGTLGPPMVVFPYKRLPLSVAKNMPPSWGIGRSDSGWMTGELFFEYIANIFYNWLVKEGIKFPIILFVDGHTSHMTLALSEFCKAKEIILIALLPNATAILQPLDVAFFHPLKQDWRIAVKKWRLERNGERIRREDFPVLLSSILNMATYEKNLRSGFKCCGLCPLDPDALNYQKLLPQQQDLNQQENTTRKTVNIDVSNTEFPKQMVESIEKYMGSSKVTDFENSYVSETWTGAKEDSSLFAYWRHLKDQVYNSQCETNDVSIGDTTLSNNFPDLDKSLNENNITTVDLDDILGNKDTLTLNINVDGSCVVEDGSPEKNILNSSVDNIYCHHELPSPFKRNLIWPEPATPSSSTKRQKREKLPAVVSSTEWIQFNKKKADKKQKELLEKEERKRLRLEKQGNKTTIKKNLDVACISKFKTNQHVIVNYESELFPGVILEIKKNEYFVKVMVMSGMNWRWPEKDDVCWYEENDILEVIEEPILINARGVYSVPSIKDMRDAKITN